jgi:CHAD domain-containing protein
VKAKKVKGLDPRGPLSENAARIVSVRLAEMRAFVPAAFERDEVRAQHDMRVAAKRLRYVLETVGLCFGEVGDTARQGARDVQTVLGDLHDCDVLIQTVERYTSAAGAPPTDRGLELLVTRTVERRDRLHSDFQSLWARLDGEAVWTRLASAAESAGSG